MLLEKGIEPHQLIQIDIAPCLSSFPHDYFVLYLAAVLEDVSFSASQLTSSTSRPFLLVLLRPDHPFQSGLLVYPQTHCLQHT